MAVSRMTFETRPVNLANCTKGAPICTEAPDCSGAAHVCTGCVFTAATAILTTPNCLLLDGLSLPLLVFGTPAAATGSTTVAVSPPAVLCHSGGVAVLVDEIRVTVDFACQDGRWAGTVHVVFFSSTQNLACDWHSGAAAGFPFRVPGNCPPSFTFDFDFTEPGGVQSPDPPCVGPATLTVT